MIIVIVVFLVAVVGFLVFLIFKSIISPKKLDSVPRLLKQGKTQSAIKILKQAISKDPKNYQAHYLLGKTYLQEGKPELAVIEYKNVDEHAVFGEGIDEVPFRKDYASLLMKYNNPAEALKNYLLLTKMEPQNAENFFQAGTIYEQQNRYDLAMGFMQKTTMLNKRHAKAHAEIGLMLYRTKQFNDAKREIDTALKLSPDSYGTYYYLGKILKDGKDLQGAIKAFEKAQRDPDIKQKAIIEHGSCYMIAGRHDNAAVDFIRAIELDKAGTSPETLYARYFLGLCYEKTRKIDKAIEQWEAIYKKNKAFRDVSAKLSEYKDLQANDFLKDYLTSSNEEFIAICKNTVQKGMGLQILTCDTKKWGCQLTAVNKSDESWMSVRKQVALIRFYRNPEPVEEQEIHETNDLMKSQNYVKSFLFSSADFAPTAKRFAENRPIELIGKDNLEKILSKAGA